MGMDWQDRRALGRSCSKFVLQLHTAKQVCQAVSTSLKLGCNNCVKQELSAVAV